MARIGRKPKGPEKATGPKKVSKRRQKPGPEGDTLALDGSWEESLKEALRKKRPPEGWPSPPRKKRQKRG